MLDPSLQGIPFPATSHHGVENTAAHLEHLLAQIQSSVDTAMVPLTSPNEQLQFLSRFRQLQEAIHRASAELRISNARYEDLAKAQADAIVRSAEIIEELEATKVELDSARTAAVRAAAEKEMLAQTIYAKTNDAVLILREGKCVSANPNTLQLFDVRIEEILLEWPSFFSADNLIDGSMAESFLKELHRQAVEGNPGSLEIAIKRHQETLWCEVRMNPFEMEGASHVLVNVNDITARHELEEAVRHHRDFLFSIINAVPDPLCVVDHADRFVVANDSFCETIEQSRDETLGSLASDLGYSIRPRSPSAQETGAVEETVQKQLDGKHHIYSVRKAVFHDQLSKKPYYIAVSRDVTEQRQREDRLSLLASVFNNIAEGVAILSLDGRILEANPRLLELLNISGSVEIELRKALDLGIENLESKLQQVAQGRNWAGKISAKTSDGKSRWFWLSLSASTSLFQKETQIIALFSDVTQLERSQRQLAKQALNDNLTGLHNRRYFSKQVHQWVRDHRHSEKHFAVIFMDLDDFKSINDVSGHGTGDRLLIEVGKLLREKLGHQAIVARFGGDEFAAMLEFRSTDSDRVRNTLTKVIERFQHPLVVDNREITTGVSIGVAIFPDHGSDSQTLMSNADIAMYAAKSAGKNQFRFFSQEMQAKTEYRHQLQLDLRRALQNDGISLAFQPKVEALLNTNAGVEALARWRKEDGTLVPPSEFIPIAEESGLILQLGNQVLSKAIRTARDWHERGIQLLPIAINVSPQQLRSPDFVEHLDHMVQLHQVQPSWIELEITENAVIEDIQYAIDTFRRLHQRGFRIAIDDFGTGYSSLNYLRHFQIDTLKIDRSFVSEVTTDKNLAAISNAIISLGHGLGLKVVAEGVETEEQKAFLANAGCDILQGYLISRPVFIQEAEAWAHAKANANRPSPS